jgi:hypothetical protein
MAKLGRFSALHQPTARISKRRTFTVSVAPPPGGGDPAGSIVVGYDSAPGPGQNINTAGFDVFYVNSTIGSTTGPGGGPAVLTHLVSLAWLQNYTQLGFVPGTYTGFTVDSENRVNGSSADISVTVDGVTTTFTLFGSTPFVYRADGDPFSLQTKVGQTLNVVLNGNV